MDSLKDAFEAWASSGSEYEDHQLQQDLLELLNILYEQVSEGQSYTNLRNQLGIKEESHEEHILNKHFYWFSLYKVYELAQASEENESLENFAHVLMYYPADTLKNIWKDLIFPQGFEYRKLKLAEAIAQNLLILHEISSQQQPDKDVVDIRGLGAFLFEVLKESESQLKLPLSKMLVGKSPLDTEEAAEELGLIPSDQRFSVLGLIGRLKHPHSDKTGGAVLVWRVQIEEQTATQTLSSHIQLIPPVQDKSSSYDHLAGCVERAVNKELPVGVGYRAKAWLTHFFPSYGSPQDYDLPNVLADTEGPSFGLPFSLMYRCLLLPHYQLSDKWASSGKVASATDGKEGQVLGVGYLEDKLDAVEKSKFVKGVYLPDANRSSNLMAQAPQIEKAFVSDLKDFYSAAEWIDPFNFDRDNKRSYLQVIQQEAERLNQEELQPKMTSHDQAFLEAYTQLGQTLAENPFAHKLWLVRTPGMAKQVAYLLAARLAGRRLKLQDALQANKPVAVPVFLSVDESAWEANMGTHLIDKIVASLTIPGKISQNDFPTDIKDHVHNLLFGQDSQFVFLIYHAPQLSVMADNTSVSETRLGRLTELRWFKQLIHFGSGQEWGVIPKRKHTMVLLSQYSDQVWDWRAFFEGHWVMDPPQSEVYCAGDPA